MTDRRILILDDEALVAFDLADLLETGGYAVCGPHTTEGAALAAVAANAPDAALLDVNLGRDRTSASVADALQAGGVPFAFLTGYAQIDSRLDARFRDRPRLGKPFHRPEVLAMVAALLGGSAGA